jgi:hypothetical protein
MANSFVASYSVAAAMANTITTQLDQGGSGHPPLIDIYAGTPPASPDAATTGTTLLAELTCSSVAFGAATNGSPGAVITANSITSTTNAAATGTAAFFRLSGYVTSSYQPMLQGSVGTSGCDMNLNTTAITSGSTVSITSATITHPQGPSG